MTTTLNIDLTTELGEGFAVDPGGVPLDVLNGMTLPETGGVLHPRHTAERADEALIPLISSAYLACGLHSGENNNNRNRNPQSKKTDPN